jgi:hypothetical protein
VGTFVACTFEPYAAPDAGRVDEVLHADRNPVQRAAMRAARDLVGPRGARRRGLAPP